MKVLLFALLLATGPTKTQKDPNFMLRHELGNFATELVQAKARIESQETVIEAIRREMDNHLAMNKELVKGTLSETSGKVDELQKISQDFAGDLVALKKSVESALSKLEKEMDAQSKNIRHLELALKSVLDALGVDTKQPTLSSDRGYTVKDGDSLGKIAIAFNTTTKALKEHNNLTKDTIRVGQKLQIP